MATPGSSKTWITMLYWHVNWWETFIYTKVSLYTYNTTQLFFFIDNVAHSLTIFQFLWHFKYTNDHFCSFFVRALSWKMSLIQLASLLLQLAPDLLILYNKANVPSFSLKRQLLNLLVFHVCYTCALLKIKWNKLCTFCLTYCVWLGNLRLVTDFSVIVLLRSINTRISSTV